MRHEFRSRHAHAHAAHAHKCTHPQCTQTHTHMHRHRHTHTHTHTTHKLTHSHAHAHAHAHHTHTYTHTDTHTHAPTQARRQMARMEGERQRQDFNSYMDHRRSQSKTERHEVLHSQANPHPLQHCEQAVSILHDPLLFLEDTFYENHARQSVLSMGYPLGGKVGSWVGRCQYQSNEDGGIIRVSPNQLSSQ